MERPGFDFGTLTVIIIWVIDDAEHNYEKTVLKLKGIYDYFGTVIHCKMHKTEGSI